MKIIKKTAMFGLDSRTLRKQFGELFLVSRHSEASKGASGSRGYAKRGAMFGLDARIALAIFSALSVISGASLYSAVQESQTVKLATNFKEIAKAVEAYILDVGTDIPADGRYVHGFELIESSENGWNGPYLQGERHTTPTDTRLIYNSINPGAFLWILKQSNTDVGNVQKTILNDCIAGTPNCHYWIKAYTDYIGFGDSLDIINRLDEYFDGLDGLDTGSIRYTYYMDGGNLKPILYYKLMPVLTQP